MSKLKYVTMLLLVSVLALTGCNKKNSLSADETIKKAVAYMESVENYKMKASISMGIKSSGISMDMSFDMNGTYDAKNGISKMNMSTNMFGMAIETESYSDTKSEPGKVITYTKDAEGNWSKEISDASEDNSEDTKKLLEKMLSSGNIKEVKADKSNYNYEVTINSDTLKSMMDFMGNEIDEISLDSFKGDIVVKISLDKKTYAYSKMSMDMTDMLKQTLASSSDMQGVEFSKAEFVITFSDYNNAGSVEIPKEALEAEEDDIVYNNSEFNEDDYDRVLTCKVSNNDDGIDASMDLLIGFNNDISVAGYYKVERKFDSNDEANEFYDEYDPEDGEDVSVNGNVVSITYFGQLDEDEQMSYDDASSYYNYAGYSCN